MSTTGRPHFLVQKLSGFSKYMVCLHGQGGRGLSQCENFSDKEEGSIFHVVFAFGQFFTHMVCSHGQGGRGLSQCEHFSDKEEGSIFLDFVRTSFMDGLIHFLMYI